MTAPAEVLAAQRAEVIVPPGVTAGPLGVSSPVERSNELPFRATSFTLGLQAFRSEYEQADVARRMPSIAVARASAITAQIGDWLYVLCGTEASAPGERARLNGDGTVDAFAAVPAVSCDRSHPQGAVLGSWLYVIGGAVGKTYPTAVLRAHIGADGSLGPLEDAGTALVAGRRRHALELVGEYVYVLGGESEETDRADVERAAVRPDGTLGAFERVDGVLLSRARLGAASAVVGQGLYVLGGYSYLANDSVDIVDRAQINADGTIGPFAPVTPLPQARLGARALQLGGALYLVGGRQIRPIQDDSLPSLRAQIDANGALGPFANVDDAVLTRIDPQLILVGDHAYAVGGVAYSAQARIERASLVADGQLDPFVGLGGTLDTPRAYFRSVAIGRWLYAIGGQSTVIARAPIAPDGLPGGFVATTTGLLEKRGGATLAVLGDWLYVLGGQTGARSVERAPIGADASLGAFAEVAGLGFDRAEHASVVVGDRLYVFGGFGGGSELATIVSAAIDPSGELAPFQAAGALGTARYGAAVVVLGERVYVSGGNYDLTSIERATIGPAGALSAFTPSGSFAAARTYHQLAAIGPALYTIGGIGPSDYVGSLERAPIAADGSLGAFTLATATLGPARGAFAANLLGDRLVVLGGAISGNTGDYVDGALIR